MSIKLFHRDQFVDFHLQGKVIKFCKITAVKDCETGFRYDLDVENVKLYDISQDLLVDIAQEVTNNTLLQVM